MPSSDQSSLPIECNQGNHYGEVPITGCKAWLEWNQRLPVSSFPPGKTPDDNKILDRDKLIGKTLSEMQAQMKAMKEEVTAAEALKQSTHGRAAKSSH